MGNYYHSSVSHIKYTELVNFEFKSPKGLIILITLVRIWILNTILNSTITSLLFFNKLNEECFAYIFIYLNRI